MFPVFDVVVDIQVEPHQTLNEVKVCYVSLEFPLVKSMARNQSHLLKVAQGVVDIHYKL